MPPYTAMTMKALREDGWMVDKVEQTVPKSFIKRDLYGCVDVLALRGIETLAVQTTSYPNVPARVRKIKGEKLDALVAMAAAGWRVEVWGWRKVPLKKGGKAMRWTRRVVECEPDPILVYSYLKSLDSTIVDP